MKIADTALPVAALTNEAETERMQHWLGRQPEDNLAISDWVATEFSSALYSEDRPVDRSPAHRRFTFLSGCSTRLHDVATEVE